MKGSTLFNCSETPDRFLAYLDGELPVAEAHDLERHLDGCPGCRNEADSLSRLHRDLSQRAADLECMESDPIPALLAKARWDEASGARRRRRWLTRREGPPRALPWIVAAAAAACLLIVSAALIRPRPAATPDELPPPVAEHAPAPRRAAPPAPAPAVPVRERNRKRGTFPSLPPAAPAPRVAETAPEPKPEAAPPVKPTRPAARPTLIAVARFESVSGSVALGESEAAAGARIVAGARVVTGGPGARARILLPDGTRLQLGAGTTVTFATGKRFELDRGTLLADVTPQPKGDRVVIATPRAEVKVLGTRLDVTADPDATRVGVAKGRVRVVRLRDGWGVFVSAGHETLVAPGVPFKAVPKPRNLLSNPGFESGTQSWRWPLPTDSDSVRTGTLCQKIPARTSWTENWQPVDVRSGASYAASTWIRTEGLQGKGAALRVVWLDAAGRRIRYEDFGWVAGSQGWTRVNGLVTAPANVARMQFMVFIEGEPDGSGAAWFDDCALFEATR